MASTATCPECNARLTLRAAPRAGARLKCPKCSTQFAYTDTGDEESPAAPKKSAISAGSPARRRRDQDEDDEKENPRSRSKARSDEEEEERRPRKKKKAKAGSNTGLIIGIAAGVGGLLVLGIAAVVVVFVVMREKPGVVQPLAQANPPGPLPRRPGWVRLSLARTKRPSRTLARPPANLPKRLTQAEL